MIKRVGTLMVIPAIFVAMASSASASSDVPVLAARAAFAPSQVVLPQGVGLQLVNGDATAHTLTAVDFNDKGVPLFSSTIVGAAGIKPVQGVETLTPGEYVFICQIHPFMIGTLTVVANPDLPSSR